MSDYQDLLDSMKGCTITGARWSSSGETGETVTLTLSDDRVICFTGYYRLHPQLVLQIKRQPRVAKVKPGIQAVIDRLSAEGGGEVHLEPGRYDVRDRPWLIPQNVKLIAGPPS